MPGDILRMPKKSSFLGDVLKLKNGTAMAQALSVFTAPIFSRIFLPES